MLRPIHPFPARMAPELARVALNRLEPGSRVLDPMCGSGTVLRQAVERGLDCVGYDVDPLAVMMAEAWTTKVEAYRLLHDAHLVAERARDLLSRTTDVPWRSSETEHFAEYWFAPTQRDNLTRLAHALKRTRLISRALLKVCFSRVIITKDRGASLARDVSHSRPHRVCSESDFDVFGAFLDSARQVSARMSPELIRGKARVYRRDARLMTDRDQYDLAITSPPYLNAIDYLRGHRLSLIWFGHEVAPLRRIRSESIGAERRGGHVGVDIERFVTRRPGSTIQERHLGWIQRFAGDMEKLLRRLSLAVRSNGRVVLVVGNSFIGGAVIDNVGLILDRARIVGLKPIRQTEREILARRRYLPPPSPGSPLSLRMRSEAILEFSVP